MQFFFNQYRALLSVLGGNVRSKNNGSRKAGAFRSTWGLFAYYITGFFWELRSMFSRIQEWYRCFYVDLEVSFLGNYVLHWRGSKLLIYHKEHQKKRLVFSSHWFFARQNLFCHYFAIMFYLAGIYEHSGLLDLIAVLFAYSLVVSLIIFFSGASIKEDFGFNRMLFLSALLVRSALIVSAIWACVYYSGLWLSVGHACLAIHIIGFFRALSKMRYKHSQMEALLLVPLLLFIESAFIGTVMLFPAVMALVSVVIVLERERKLHLATLTAQFRGVKSAIDYAATQYSRLQLAERALEYAVDVLSDSSNISNWPKLSDNIELIINHYSDLAAQDVSKIDRFSQRLGSWYLSDSSPDFKQACARYLTLDPRNYEAFVSVRLAYRISGYSSFDPGPCDHPYLNIAIEQAQMVKYQFSDLPVSLRGVLLQAMFAHKSQMKSEHHEVLLKFSKYLVSSQSAYPWIDRFWVVPMFMRKFTRNLIGRLPFFRGRTITAEGSSLARDSDRCLSMGSRGIALVYLGYSIEHDHLDRRPLGDIPLTGLGFIDDPAVAINALNIYIMKGRLNDISPRTLLQLLKGICKKSSLDKPCWYEDSLKTLISRLSRGLVNAPRDDGWQACRQFFYQTLLPPLITKILLIGPLNDICFVRSGGRERTLLGLIEHVASCSDALLNERLLRFVHGNLSCFRVLHTTQAECERVFQLIKPTVLSSHYRCWEDVYKFIKNIAIKEGQEIPYDDPMPPGLGQVDHAMVEIVATARRLFKRHVETPKGYAKWKKLYYEIMRAVHPDKCRHGLKVPESLSAVKKEEFIERKLRENIDLSQQITSHWEVIEHNLKPNSI